MCIQILISGSYYYSSGKEMLIKFMNHNDDASALSKKEDIFEVQYIEADGKSKNRFSFQYTILQFIY